LLNIVHFLALSNLESQSLLILKLETHLESIKVYLIIAPEIKLVGINGELEH
jgi:hypothetical protein